MIREFLFPLAWGYQGVSGFRNWLYDIRLFRAHKADAKVISIGNLTAGGTGKTPMTLAMIDELQRQGYSCGVISRGYRRSTKGVQEVDTSSKAPQLYGDEPALIKATYPDIPVFVGEKRFAAATALLASKKVDFIVCDDAFQHRALHRDLNLVLIDVTEMKKNYRVLPVGLARENWVKALRRADVILLTKTNLVDSTQLQDVKTWIQSRSDKPIVCAEYEFDRFRDLNGKTSDHLTDKAYLVSAIAKPEFIEKTLGDRVKIVKHKSFGDHFRYTDLEIEAVLDEASQLQARWILTTSKDAVKMKAFRRLHERLWIAELSVKFRDGKKDLYEAIDRLGRATS